MAYWRLISVAAALLAASPAIASAENPDPVDEETGLALDEHFELVRANCTRCHSSKLITQAQLSRDDWTATLRWMQATQGLWPFSPATENQLLDYLVRHYGPGDRAPRRKPLPPSLRPPSRESLTPNKRRNSSSSSGPEEKRDSGPRPWTPMDPRPGPELAA